MTQPKSTGSFMNQAVNHPHFNHFLLYSMSYIFYGQILTCLGPMFPYLAAVEDRQQTEYSFLFFCRALGFITGSVMVRFIGTRVKLHQYIAIAVSLLGLFSLLFIFPKSLYVKGFCIYVSCIGGSLLDISLNIAALECFKGGNVSTWLQIIHGAFGIGGLLGPFIVYAFELNTLIFLGGISLLPAALYFKLETPENFQVEKSQGEHQKKEWVIPESSIYLISFGFLLAVGQEVSYGGWISSYAVLSDFSTKEHATFYSSVYWISITFFRFTLAAVSGSPTYKIKVLAMIGMATTLVGYFTIFHVNPEFGLISMTILFGLTNSVLYPLLLTIPQQFGFKITIQQNTIFIIWSSLGEGCLAIIVGKLMEWFSYNWLLYSVGIMNLFLFFVMKYNTQLMSDLRDQFEGKLERFIKSDKMQDDKICSGMQLMELGH